MKSYSRELRKNMTDAERIIWRHLRNKQILGVQFYRQKTLGNYIVDFYCPRACIVVEVDGGQHYEKEAQEADCIRDEKLNALGLKVLRFNNNEVITNIDGVLNCIYNEIKNII
ncbi:endonuclease domain-containing protein [Seleniivibrio sp.]|uniref:endonuclease domain-containing protein n=1 Tax=Seleniivibrio sp. TaxID=2898801 RepID=UPI0025D447CD|nr:endonuclease domain-containing protein [Seleniivibrio sp.]